MKRSKAIIRTIMLCMVGIFIGISLYMFNANKIMGNALPMPFGYGVAMVLSGSMEPKLSVDDLIFVKQTDDFKEGDIVVYQESGYLIVHRVVSMDGERVQTKGDANDTGDEPIEKKKIEGKVIGRVPFVGGIIKVLKTPVGTISVLVLAFLLLEFSYKKEKNKDDEEIEKIKEEIERLKKEEEAR
ncbi:signal peptidase I [Aequitasia blattaphilus]|uniref:Signal peptidase I n=1 Tax=Aequitasia blattaphilus TaxID=2949332 RepID=A0ABT1E504_9FIRM|nr:signal peptidase I [Aequitasia blattaphilus]MCP1100917.1 signal peptidase I [Aequitasia blattaphilus]MCR8613557.1 signal peptidase I [Aequitasia blattaphilus]